MKLFSHKKTNLIIAMFFCLFQSNYAQKIYNWDEYYILKNETELSCLQGNTTGSNSTFSPTVRKSTDKVQLTNLCASCNGQVWRIVLSPSNFSPRPDADNYGYIINTASQKYLTYDATTGLVSQKQKLPDATNQSQRWYMGNGFEMERASLPIKPFLDSSKFLNFTTDKSGGTILSASSTSRNWYIKPTKPVAVTLTNIRNLCPTKNTRGDREFNGNGPIINLRTTLTIRNNDSEIWASIDFKATETKSDWSTVEGIWEFKVYTAPTGKKIKDIVMDKSVVFEDLMSSGAGMQIFANLNTTNRNQIDSLEKGFWSPVREVKLVGDTGGDDISTDSDCTDDTRIEEINFRPLYIIFE